jgi:hypothetical protein
MNRYYGSTLGRFLTPDPYGGSPTLARPSSWNRYAYVEGDPVNNTDRSGLFLDGTSRAEGGWVFWVDLAFDFGGWAGGHPPLVPLDGPRRICHLFHHPHPPPEVQVGTMKVKIVQMREMANCKDSLMTVYNEEYERQCRPARNTPKISAAEWQAARG